MADHGLNLTAREKTARAIERVARESYGRLVAYLSAHTRDVAGAEDALSEALCAALAAWPRDGVPANPSAWLLTTARHTHIDFLRHQRMVLANEPTLRLLHAGASGATVPSEFPDERLKLLFVCAHPAIDAAMHAPLMLQTVLGLDAARIGKAFLVVPATMGQRLVRAKTKIRRGGLRFEVPEPPELPRRLDAVLEAIYAAFGIGWEDVAGVDQGGPDLAEEAIWLARVLVELLPEAAEVRGLLALMLYCESRRGTRRGADGEYVPLSEQNPRHWSVPLIMEAEEHLAEASRRGRTGRFQLEAAIQSVHAERAATGRIEWEGIVVLYKQLLRVAPTVGSRTGYAAAVAEVSGPEAGLAVLDAIEPQLASTYQPYWAVRAHLCQRLGRTREAVAASERAIGLAEDPAVRQFLIQQQR